MEKTDQKLKERSKKADTAERGSERSRERREMAKQVDSGERQNEKGKRFK